MMQRELGQPEEPSALQVAFENTSREAVVLFDDGDGVEVVGSGQSVRCGFRSPPCEVIVIPLCYDI